MQGGVAPNRWGRWATIGAGVLVVVVVGVAAIGGLLTGWSNVLGLLAVALLLSIPFGLLVLLIARLVVGVGRERPAAPSPLEGDRLCPDCGQGIEAHWDACPHCGAAFEELEASETRV